MTSSVGKQIITIHILPNISRSKGNQTMKFGQLVEYKVKNTFLQKSCKNEPGRLVPDFFCFFKKFYVTQKRVVNTLVSYILVVLDVDIE